MLKSVLFQTIQFSIQKLQFQTIQFSIRMQFSSIWPIDRAVSSATTLGHSGPESYGNEGVLHISQTPASLKPHHQIV